jgi:hypothetical protein
MILRAPSQLEIDGDSTCHEVEARVSTGGDYKAELSVRALKQTRGLPGPAFERRYDERKSRSGTGQKVRRTLSRSPFNGSPTPVS